MPILTRKIVLKLITSASTIIKIEWEQIKYSIRRMKEINTWAMKYKTKTQ